MFYLLIKHFPPRNQNIFKMIGLTQAIFLKYTLREHSFMSDSSSLFQDQGAEQLNLGLVDPLTQRSTLCSTCVVFQSFIFSMPHS